MTFKRAQRAISPVSRDFQSDKEVLPSWAKDYANVLDKSAVESKGNTIYDQISSIMGNVKPKYPSVGAAVEEMQERAGLTAYLKSNQEKSTIQKSASANEESVLPIVIQKLPFIASTIENYVRSSNGNLPVPAIVAKVKSIHKSDLPNNEDWEDPNLPRYINELVSKVKLPDNKDYSNLGVIDKNLGESDIDPTNTDAFHSLMPTKF